MRSKKIPLSKQEHLELAKSLRSAQELLEPWLERIDSAYAGKSIERKQLHQILNLLSSKICCSLDKRWYQENNDHESPYFGDGKVFWGKIS